jgi:dihydroorotate dehydrogenase (NAD+) catalytic subunit
MARHNLTASLGPIDLATPLIAASGTVGSVWEWEAVADVRPYGAAVCKSVSLGPWEGRPPPRLAPTGVGMLNGIGIQNPGIERWSEEVAPRLAGIGVPVWGSAVGETADEFALVAKRLAEAGVAAIELNLSCPNLEGDDLFSFDARLSAVAVESAVSSVNLPVGAKLSPDTPDIVAVAAACLEAGAAFLTLTNTALGFGIDPTTRRPLLSGGAGGYSGPGLKPISLRCVHEVARSLPGAPIIGCGGVRSGRDVIEYLMTGASAVGLGSVHLAEPKAGHRIIRELEREMSRLGVEDVASLVGAMEPW